MLGDTPMFHGGDVCKILGYTNPSEAFSDHCKYSKLLSHSETLGLELNPFGVLVIPESDLYRLILGSNMPKAEEFKKWVTEEVLPAIRKTGGYEVGHPQVSRQLERFLLSSGELGALKVKLPC
jgi:anti-repressor protein